jgi:hypothetical protein
MAVALQVCQLFGLSFPRILRGPFSENAEKNLMVAANSNDRVPSARANPVLPDSILAQRVRQYFEQQSEVARENFLLEALRRGIPFREQRETGNGAGSVRREGEGTNTGSSARPPLSAEDIRLHAWLSERLAMLHYERHGLWPKLRRFLFENRLVLWLGLLKSDDRRPR